MKSVADRLRAEDRQRLLRLSPAERVALALALGERDLEAFRRARGVSRGDARRLLERQRQEGRRRSRCLLALTE